MCLTTSLNRRALKSARSTIAALLLLSVLALSLIVSFSSSAQTTTDERDTGQIQLPLVIPPAGEAYRQTNFVSDVPGIALLRDPLLVNPWGISLTATSPFWISNNGTSTSVLYGGDVSGPLTPNALKVTIPGDLPTGTVANGTNDFVVTSGAASGPARFLFASLTGNIPGWNPSVPAAGSTVAQIAASHPGHVYTGLAIGNNGVANFLYAADFANGTIDVFNSTFALQSSALFPFIDPTIPAGFHPFNIQNLGGTLYVAYAQVGADGRSANGPGLGFVSKFNLNGVFLGRLISNGALNAPWGMTIAPASFGVFSNAFLVGNFADKGTINAYNPTTGAFLGTVSDEGNNPIEIDQLWALTFGNGVGGGSTNTLYFNAGIGDEEHGLFGSLKATTAAATSFLQFSASSYGVGEASGQAVITVTRAGDVSGPATVNFAALPESQPGQATPGALFREGTVLTAVSFTTNSYERKPGGAAGSTQDTGNNAADFQLRAVNDPQNLASPPTPAPGSSSAAPTILISEFRLNGSGGSRDQFVELYNNSDTPLDISGWKLKASDGPGTSFGQVYTLLTINPGTTIPARGHFLATGPAYSGSVAGDQSYPGSPNPFIFINGGIAITRPDDTISDQVGMSDTADYVLSAGTLTFAPGETSRTFQVAIVNDSVVEGNESVNLVLSNPTGAALIAPNVATLTIFDATGTPPQAPSISINDVSVVEGNAGVTNAVFTVSQSSTSALTTSVNFNTLDGTATSPSDYTANFGSINFAPGEMSKTITVQVKGDTTLEPDETFFVILSDPANATIADGQGVGTILNDDSATPGSSVQFQPATYTVSEGVGSFVVTVTRSDTTSVATVDFTTSDSAGSNPCSVINGFASQRCDYMISEGTLQFEPGESSKTIPISIVDDVYVEGNESFSLTLSNPSGFSLGANSTATVTITDNDSSAAPNPIDTTGFFIRQQYLDLLGREPDPGGFTFWSGQLDSCGTDTACRNSKRVAISAAFFIAQEFQQTGFFVYRVRKASLGQQPTYLEYILDRTLVGTGSDAEKTAFTQGFVQRPGFLARYPTSQTGSQFIDAVIVTVQENSSVDLTPRRSDLINEYIQGSTQVDSRARVIQTVVDLPEFIAAETNMAFVLSEYFGYLRRDPDTAGFQFWLNILNNNNGNFTPMVCAFVNSAEYQLRFGPTAPHNDTECSQ
jgi:uncharacterized protein (TIGR03118 family)